MSEKLRIYNPIKNRFVNVNQFGAAAKKLYKIYIDELNTPPENVLPPGLKYNPVSGYFTKTKEQKEKIIYNNVKKLAYTPTFNGTEAQLKVETTIKNFMKQFAGKTIKAVSYSQGNIKNEGIITIPSSYNAWWKVSPFFQSYIMVDSEFNIFSRSENLVDLMADPGDPEYDVLLPIKKQGLLIVDELQQITGEKYKQQFLDGITNCFFTPIKDWAILCEEDAKSKSAIKRYKSINKKIDNYLIKYKEGIPEDEVQEVADNLQVGFSIDIPSPINKKVNLLTIEPQKKALKVFKFLNTRIDHVEINDLRALDNFEEISRGELEIKKRELSKNKEFFIYKSGKDGVSQLNTIYKSYKVKDPMQDIISDFENDNNLSSYKISHTKNRALSEFCKKSVKTNNTIDFDEKLQQKNPEDYNHIDMTKAYTKSNDCSYYEGILGKITDFRKTDKIMGLGLYQVNNVVINNPVIADMEYIFNNNIYPSAELKFLKDNGVDFEIVAGCWGSKIDINFGEGEEDKSGMFSKHNGVSAYCKWFGCMLICEENTKWKFSTSSENYCKIYDYYQDDSNVYYHADEYGQYGVIEYKKRETFHQSHIASFITSYQRIAMMEQLLKFKDFKQVARVCVDGIYFKGDVELCKNFSYKDKKTFENEAGKSYCIDFYDPYKHYYWENNDKYDLSKNRENNQYEFHKGPGGAGKTHNNLIDTGLIDILFASNSWKLSRSKAKEYNIDSTCFYHLLTEDPEVWRPLYKKYSVILVDEVSMLSNHNKNIIINRFKDHKIIFCGDVGYQLDPVYSPYEYANELIGGFKPEYTEYYFNDNNTEIIQEKGNELLLLNNSCIDGPMKKRIVKIPIIEHNTMYRCKCPVLKDNLLNLRKLIDTNGDKINTEDLLKILKNTKINNKNNIDYKSTDFIITNTHQRKDEYTEKFIDLEKYYITNKTREYSKGEILYEKPTGKGISCERRHGYTCHSLQGETAENKLFIDITGFKSLKMLYTAISRVKYWNQIVFIE